MSRSVVSVRNGSLPLAGRGDELRALTSVLTGSPALAVVCGEAGVGKSRLVAEALASTADSGRWTATGYCQPLREPFPYGPVLDCVRAIPDRLGDPAEANPVTGALAAYLPELAAQLPTPPAPMPAADQHRVFRAVHAV
ncbi:MAG: AAA family ATPase, partial [Thermocrispum sp.]